MRIPLEEVERQGSPGLQLEFIRRQAARVAGMLCERDWVLTFYSRRSLATSDSPVVLRPMLTYPAGTERMQTDPAWHDNLIFGEYFQGDNGAALGAFHQTGWTGLIGDVIMRRHGAAPSIAEVLSDLSRKAGQPALCTAGQAQIKSAVKESWFLLVAPRPS
jgi:hypothetical protein